MDVFIRCFCCSMLTWFLIAFLPLLFSKDTAQNTRNLPSQGARAWCTTMFPEEQTCIVNCPQDQETLYTTECSVRPGNRNVIGLKCNNTGCFIPYH